MSHMYQPSGDELLFPGSQPGVIPIYEALAGNLFNAYPDTRIKVSNSQISFHNRHLYACVSFARVKKKKELPDFVTKSENTMKNVFYRLRDHGFLRLVRGFNCWEKTESFEQLVAERFPALNIM